MPTTKAKTDRPGLRRAVAGGADADVGAHYDWEENHHAGQVEDPRESGLVTGARQEENEEDQIDGDTDV
jgi:hypothetical protein